MKKDRNKISLSATDLAGHLNCAHLTGLDLEVANGRLKAPTVPRNSITAIAGRLWPAVKIAHCQMFAERPGCHFTVTFATTRTSYVLSDSDEQLLRESRCGGSLVVDCLWGCN